MTEPEPITISVPEAARLLGISERHAYYMAREGKLHGAYRMGNRWLVHLGVLRRESERMAMGIPDDRKRCKG